MVRCYAAALMGRADAVDDVAQEVFVRAIARLDLFRGHADPGRLLRGFVRRVVKEYARARRRERAYADVHALGEAGAACAAAAACGREDRERLRAAVEDLPVVSRRVLEMRYVEGRSAAEIGRALGIEPGAVRVTLLRIRDRLRRSIEARRVAA